MIIKRLNNKKQITQINIDYDNNQTLNLSFSLKFKHCLSIY